MPSTPSFSISFASDTSVADREALLTVIRAHADQVQTATPKVLDWATFVAVMVDMGKVAGGASAIIALGKQMYAFVQTARQRGTPIKGQLERPGQAPLNLETMSEEELLAWLLQNPPKQ